MSMILSDKEQAPQGWKTQPCNDLYVHYDPTEWTDEQVGVMAQSAINGDSTELKKNSIPDTILTREYSNARAT